MVVYWAAEGAQYTSDVGGVGADGGERAPDESELRSAMKFVMGTARSLSEALDMLEERGFVPDVESTPSAGTDVCKRGDLRDGGVGGGAQAGVCCVERVTLAARGGGAQRKQGEGVWRTRAWCVWECALPPPTRLGQRRAALGRRRGVRERPDRRRAVGRPGAAVSPLCVLAGFPAARAGVVFDLSSDGQLR